MKHHAIFRWAGRRHFRGAVCVACLVAATLALLPATAREWSPVVVAALSPLVAAAAALTTRTFRATMLLGLLVAVVAVVRRRWFCRWACPTGLCARTASRLGMRLGRRCPKSPAFGAWIAWIALGGAALGYPALVWLDPLAIFCGAFGDGSWAWNGQTWLSAIGLSIVLLASLLLPGVWCLRACPLGGLQDALYLAPRTLFSRWAADPHRPSHERRWFLRRVILGGAIGACWAIVARFVRSAAPCPLRPPGAREDDTSFLGLCVRCGNCVRTCPSRIILPDGGQRGVAGWLAPVLQFQEDYCREDCTRCMEVCPSGALARQPAVEKQQMRIGLARVDMNVCLLGNDEECAICRNACPFEAISLIFSESDYSVTPVIDAGKCPGCGACEVACPTAPAKAIRVLAS
jgi:ferredoxin